jgi:hypothetical protein
VTIPENTLGGKMVLNLDAQDSDEGSNGNIGFAFVDGSDGHFVIEGM